ncbi:MAG: hypothetical protein KDB68_12325 [Planctomycetes bacterium]|nr:hypothetical protein [Planctomycetota bacterium]
MVRKPIEVVKTQGMKLKRTIASIVLLVAGTTIFVSLVAGQRIIRIGGGGRPAGNGSASEEPAAPDLNAVQPIPPTPEEAAHIADLIEQLGSTRLVQRDRAMSELASYEARALTQVREAKSHDDDEIASRCGLLEEVIQSRQGELFLASRRLNLTIDELNTYLNNEDITPLLSILRGRAQAGLVPLWARVFARLASRPQLYPSAELCIEIEGTTGYGQAIARAARAPEAAGSARNLMLLMALLPPGEPADTVEALTQLRYSVGEGRGLEEALSSALDFRTVYPAAETLAARAGRPSALHKEQEGADEVRTALALTMTSTCTEAELSTAGLPRPGEMSPILLNTWLSLLQRSGLDTAIGTAMQEVLERKADTRRISIVAGYFADTTSVATVIERFDSLPFEAQLSILDAWWLRPREVKELQPFLIQLLRHERTGIRVESARSLGQYYAHSTAKALLEAALNDSDIAPAALESLAAMSDLLQPGELQSLADMLPTANLLTRPLLVRILVDAKQPDALKPLLVEWRKNLPRNELPMAIQVLALQPETAAGAFARVRVSVRLGNYRNVETFLLQWLDQNDLAMTRSLLALDNEQGFDLLREIAEDPNDRQRLNAMCALAAGGRDGDLAADWLKRLAGEIKDPLGTGIGAAISFSTSDAAEEFRRNTLAQGIDSPNIGWVIQSVLNERSLTVTREELLGVLFDTPENAQKFAGSWDLINQPLPPNAARNLATALAFAQGQNLLSQPGIALMLAESGIDILNVLFGDAENPTPSDTLQLYTAALLGEPERAREIVKNTPMQEDGSNYQGLMIARAWMDLLPAEDNKRLKLGVASDPTNIFGATLRMQQARDGDAGALRSLLDALGPDAIRFERGATAEARLVNQRWGSPYMDSQGVAEAAYLPGITPPRLTVGQLHPLFEEPPAANWEDWWAARRALLEFDEATGKFTFTELP